MSYNLCGQTKPNGEPCKTVVPAKGMRCHSHPLVPHKPSIPLMRTKLAEPVSRFRHRDVVLEEAAQALERLQADLTTVTRAVAELLRRGS